MAKGKVKIVRKRPLSRVFSYKKQPWERVIGLNYQGRSSRPSLNFRRFRDRFTRRELWNIAIAWAVLAVAFGYVLFLDIRSIPLVYMIAASAIVLGPAFIMHELMHKFEAQKFGYQAQFMIWPAGLILALVTAFLVGLLFAAPGATYFQPDPEEPFMDPEGFTQRYGVISFAGPAINLIFGFVFLLLFYLFMFFLPYIGVSTVTIFVALVFGLGTFINFYLAAFNLLPLGNPNSIALDGAKVFRWNKKYWAASFGVSVTISALILLGVIPVLKVFGL
jgi:Zn-dependent protease